MNIALVGMPGSGKSTVAKIIAKNTGKKLVDIDKIIMQRYGDISNIFATQGENYFRKIESEVLEEFSKEKNLVIATGGGAVTVKKNFIIFTKILSFIGLTGRTVNYPREIDRFIKQTLCVKLDRIEIICTEDLATNISTITMQKQLPN